MEYNQPSEIVKDLNFDKSAKQRIINWVDKLAKAVKSTPTADSAKKIRESDVQKMSATAYEKNADMIMEAIRSGNFVYDVSGSAR